MPGESGSVRKTLVTCKQPGWLNGLMDVHITVLSAGRVDLLLYDAHDTNTGVYESGQQVIGSPNSVHVPSKMKIEILHGDNLGVAATGRAALNAENRA